MGANPASARIEQAQAALKSIAQKCVWQLKYLIPSGVNDDVLPLGATLFAGLVERGLPVGP
ncbi:MAG: hypothetical protein Q8R67_06075 [Rhodoferax sp.]|nr:hypothetical protein [Rhodoferax sp.]MDP3651236.1 hypothetical protein [Rhodoferax sp.]